MVRPEFVEAFKSDNKRFQPIMDCSEEGVITDIRFRGTSLELTLDVGGVRLKTHRSLERRDVVIGEHMRVVVYRLYAIDGDKVELLQNSEIAERDPDGTLFETYQYSTDGYFSE